MITLEQERCWIIDHLPDEHGDLTPHFPNRTDAEEELGRLRKEDEERYVVAVVRQLAAPCWTVRCDGACETAIDEDGDGLIHFTTAAEAESAVRDWEWRMLPDRVHVFCEQDAPEDGKVPAATPEQQERAGQLVLPGVMP